MFLETRQLDCYFSESQEFVEGAFVDGVRDGSPGGRFEARFARPMSARALSMRVIAGPIRWLQLQAGVALHL
jgi:hypothetical protein